jgi:hypothetical protein
VPRLAYLRSLFWDAARYDPMEPLSNDKDLSGYKKNL